MSSHPLVYSANFDLRGTPEVYSSRSSVLRDFGPSPLPGPGSSGPGNSSDSSERHIASNNGQISHGQDAAAMFSTPPMVGPLVLLGLFFMSPKASVSPLS